MKICVLIKQVPDKDSSLSISDDNISLLDKNITWVSNESDNYALEEALQIKEVQEGEVVVLTVGNESSRQVLKDAMAKGADRGILITDDSFNSLDILSIAKLIASKIKEENFDLIFSGLQSDDQGNSQLGILLSELLNMSHASLVMGTEIIDQNTIKVKKELENGWFQWVKLTLPSSISIQSGINSPRYATLKGIMMVKNKTVNEFNPSTDGIEINNNIDIKKMYIPNKSKETRLLEGSGDEVAKKVFEILKNEIKVLG